MKLNEQIFNSELVATRGSGKLSMRLRVRPEFTNMMEDARKAKTVRLKKKKLKILLQRFDLEKYLKEDLI